MNKKIIWIGIAAILVVIIMICIGLRDKKSGTTTGETVATQEEPSATFYSTDNKTVTAVFSKDMVTFSMEGAQAVSLPQAISASGARYVNADESIVFWNKGNTVTIYQNDAVVFEGTATPTTTKTTTDSFDKVTASTWVWQKTQMNDDTIITPKKADAFSISLSKDGKVSGTTDCNSFFGEYTLEKDKGLTFGLFGSTKMYCEGSQESVFTKALGNISHYMLDAQGNLVLLLKYDSGSVLFKKQ